MSRTAEIDGSDSIAAIALKTNKPGNPCDEQVLLMLGEHLRYVAGPTDVRVVPPISEGGKDSAVGGDIQALQRMLGLESAAREIGGDSLVDQAVQIVTTIRFISAALQAHLR